MKTCTKCRIPKSFDAFHKDVRYAGGYKTWCRACHTEYVRQRRKNPENKRRETALRQAWADTNRVSIRASQRAWLEWVYALKRKPCLDCGGSFPSECMDFDHVRGAKAMNIGRMVNGNKARVLAEIAKCDLVCACCHRVRTATREGCTTLKYKQDFNAKINPLKAAPCQDCGKNFPPEAMDFDHVRGVKRWGIASMATRRWSDVLDEIAKCDLVCANCHRTRTRARTKQAA